MKFKDAMRNANDYDESSESDTDSSREYLQNDASHFELHTWLASQRLVGIHVDKGFHVSRVKSFVLFALYHFS